MARWVGFERVDESGGARLVVEDGVPYAVVEVGGKPCAYVAACSHKELALVPLRVKKGALVCPHHGARFDVATGAVIDDCGKDVPTGLCPVEVAEGPEGGYALRARRRHRKLLTKTERRRVAAGR